MKSSTTFSTKIQTAKKKRKKRERFDLFKDLNDASSGTHGYFGAYLTNADRKGGALCGIVSLGDGSDKDASCEVTRLFICPPEGVSEGSFIGRVPACLRTAAGRYLHTQKIMHRLPPLPFFLSPPLFFLLYCFTVDSRLFSLFNVYFSGKSHAIQRFSSFGNSATILAASETLARLARNSSRNFFQRLCAFGADSPGLFLHF